MVATTITLLSITIVVGILICYGYIYIIEWGRLKNPQIAIANRKDSFVCYDWSSLFKVVLCGDAGMDISMLCYVMLCYMNGWMFF